MSRLERTRCLPALTQGRHDASEASEGRLRERGRCGAQRDEEGQPGDQAEGGEEQVTIRYTSEGHAVTSVHEISKLLDRALQSNYLTMRSTYYIVVKTLRSDLNRTFIYY